MKITECKKIIHTQVEEVITGRKCDICGNNIGKHDNMYNYFKISTHHCDWGNDSVDSWEYKDACCPGCVESFTKEYVESSFRHGHNTETIEIEHVNSLEGGAE